MIIDTTSRDNAKEVILQSVRLRDPSKRYDNQPSYRYGQNALL